MARSYSTRPSYTSLLRCQLRPGQRSSKRRASADSKLSGLGDQHARISQCLTQAREGQLFELLQLVRSLTLANISAPAAATATLATQGNSVRFLSACRQPPAGVLAALTAAGQLDSSSAHGPAASRALWGLLPFKLTSGRGGSGSSGGSIPCDAEPQIIGAVYSRLSKDPLWLLSASSEPPTTFGLMLEGRPRSATERDAEQCVLEFAQLADANEGEEVARRWRRAALLRAKHAAGAQTGQDDVVRRWEAEEQQQEEQEESQAIYAFASAVSGQAGASRGSKPAGALSDVDAAQLMYAYAALATAPGGAQGDPRMHTQQGEQQEDREAVRLLQMLAGLAGEDDELHGGRAQSRHKQGALQMHAAQEERVLHAFVQLS